MKRLTSTMNDNFLFIIFLPRQVFEGSAKNELTPFFLYFLMIKIKRLDFNEDNRKNYINQFANISWEKIIQEKIQILWQRWSWKNSRSMS